MRHFPLLAAAPLLLLGALLLSGCGGDDVSRTFGLQRDAPDEFQVTTRAPLSGSVISKTIPCDPGGAPS